MVIRDPTEKGHAWLYQCRTGKYPRLVARAVPLYLAAAFVIMKRDSIFSLSGGVSKTSQMA
jgi:hypothetical protein